MSVRLINELAHDRILYLCATCPQCGSDSDAHLLTCNLDLADPSIIRLTGEERVSWLGAAARIEELESALHPFAMYYNHRRRAWKGKASSVYYGTKKGLNVRYGDFRRAFNVIKHFWLGSEK